VLARSQDRGLLYLVPGLDRKRHLKAVFRLPE
jgi:hypothetical protein